MAAIVDLLRRASRTAPRMQAKQVLMALVLGATVGVGSAADENEARRLGEAKDGCAKHFITEDFGSGVVNVVIPEGNEDGHLTCPEGSINKDGKISFRCQSDGLWKVDITCFDCPGLQETVPFGTSQRQVHMPGGGEGDEHHEECSFEDGTKYKLGRITYRCETGMWKHYATTCTDEKCFAGTASVDFYGITGQVQYEFATGSGQVSVDCPGDSPDPSGKLTFECMQEKADTPGNWVFVSQTCQTCGPRSVEVEYDGHTRMIALGGATVGGVEDVPCHFDDGHQFANGKISYKCFSGGWKLWETTCSEYLCPESSMDVRMKYTEDDRHIHAAERVHVPPKNEGRYEMPCPKASKDSEGRILLECRRDGTWKLVAAECAGGPLVRPS